MFRCNLRVIYTLSNHNVRLTFEPRRRFFEHRAAIKCDISIRKTHNVPLFDGRSNTPGGNARLNPKFSNDFGYLRATSRGESVEE